MAPSRLLLAGLQEALLVALLAGCCAPLYAAGTPNLMVPAYFSSSLCSRKGLSGPWATMAQGGSNVLAIINPNSGPDRTGVDMTQLCMPHLRAAGVRSIGYVSTNYGDRDVKDIMRDIDTYQKQFGSHFVGIFLDEGTSWWDTSAAQLKVYRTAVAYVRRKYGTSSVVVINSGTRFPPQFLELAVRTHSRSSELQLVSLLAVYHQYETLVKFGLVA
mmetsp:Transcript_5640/g.16125  ORF Transcript_5640/g.16125 Transcript_5640/m.16125 type:complete len:216 (-) Transcript_5640:954-1601(-)